MHDQAVHFVNWAIRVLADRFRDGRVLESGSGDINGNNRRRVPHREYIGNDIAPGPNVDVVCETGKLSYPDEHFDLILSTEVLEHDMKIAESLKNSVRMLKPLGVLCITCASVGRAEHGTRRTSSSQSFTTKLDDGAWNDYYENVTLKDIAKHIDLDQFVYRAYYNAWSWDLYFVGIKKPTVVVDDDASSMASLKIPEYHAESIIELRHDRDDVYDPIFTESMLLMRAGWFTTASSSYRLLSDLVKYASTIKLVSPTDEILSVVLARLVENRALISAKLAGSVVPLGRPRVTCVRNLHSFNHERWQKMKGSTSFDLKLLSDAPLSDDTSADDTSEGSSSASADDDLCVWFGPRDDFDRITAKCRLILVRYQSIEDIVFYADARYATVRDIENGFILIERPSVSKVSTSILKL